MRENARNFKKFTFALYLRRFIMCKDDLYTQPFLLVEK